MAREFVIMLLTLGGLLPGGPSLPKNNEGWSVQKEWIEEEGYFVFQGENTNLVDQCRSDPSLEIAFPYIFHSYQKIYIDQHLLYTGGDPHRGETRSFAATPVISCDYLIEGKSIRWIVYSTSLFFSHFKEYPQIGRYLFSILSFNEIAHFCGGIIMCIILLLFLAFFWGRANNRALLAFSIMSVAYLVYAVSFVPYIWGIKISMYPCEKIGDIGALIVLSSSCWLTLLQGYGSKSLLRFVSIAGFFGVVGILAGDNIDESQLCMNIVMFLYGIFSLNLLYIVSRSLIKNRSMTNFLGFGATLLFAVAFISDGLTFMNIIYSPLLSPFAILGFSILHGIRFDLDIRRALEERIDLKERLAESQRENLIQAQRGQVERAIASTTARIVHDIKTPFSALKAIFQALRAGNLKTESLERIAGQIDATIRYVDELLANLLHPPSANKNLETVAIKPMVEEIVKSYIKNPALQVEVNINIEGVSAQAIQIRRLLTNLIVNAMEAQKQGRIWIKAEKSDENTIAIIVGNDSAFIPQDRLQTLFQEYNTHGKKYGTGLGLIVCKEIVTSLSGEIECYSNPSFGTEFRISFPRVASLT